MFEKYSYGNLEFISLSKTFVLIAFLLISVSSCSEDSTVKSTLPTVSHVVPEQIYWGGELTVHGQNLSLSSDSSYVLITAEADSSIIVPSGDCISWSGSRIILSMPLHTVSGILTVVVNSVKCDPLDISISKTPDLEMILIPAGQFQMGSNYGFTDEAPVHSVEISNDFYISKFELTQVFWKSLFGDKPDNYISDNHPIRGLSWNNAAELCNAMSLISEYDSCYMAVDSGYMVNPQANGFRLPTEAEWEYACRAGSTGDYSGDGILENMGYYNANSGYKLFPTGSKKANAFGLHDR